MSYVHLVYLGYYQETSPTLINSLAKTGLLRIYIDICMMTLIFKVALPC